MTSAPRLPKRSALVGQVIENLQYSISSGEWPVGSKLPLETELLETFGVSRVTLRQAVQALVHVGVLETIQGKGTFVLASHEIDTVLSRYLRGEDLRHLLEARLAIEAEAASLAALRATDEEIEQLTTILDQSRSIAQQGDIAALAPLSALFHNGIVAAAHNPVLFQIYSPLAAETEYTVLEASEHQPLLQFVDEHAEILEAISRHDSEAAFSLARNHLADTLEAITN